MRRAKQRVAILSILIALLAATEMSLRNFDPQQTAYVPPRGPLFKSGDYFTWRPLERSRGSFQSGLVNVNSLGYRGEEFAAEKGHAVRILAVGDEATFGWGGPDEDSYPAQLQTFLTERFPEKRWQVINAGLIAGDAPDTYYLYLKREGLALEPDLILLGLFVRDDLDSDTAPRHEWIEQDVDGLPLRIRDADSEVVGNHRVPRGLPLRYRVPLVSRSHVFQRVVNIVSTLAPSAPPDDTVPFNYRVTYEDRTTTVFARVFKLLTAMNKMAQARGIPLYVLIIPERAQMNPRAFAGRQGDSQRPQKVLREFFDREGIRYIDLLPALRAASGGRSIHLEWLSVPDPTGVPDALGNYLIAEHTVAVLAKEWITGNGASAGRDRVSAAAVEDETARRLRGDSRR